MTPHDHTSAIYAITDKNKHSIDLRILESNPTNNFADFKIEGCLDFLYNSTAEIGYSCTIIKHTAIAAMRIIVDAFIQSISRPLIFLGDSIYPMVIFFSDS